RSEDDVMRFSVSAVIITVSASATACSRMSPDPPRPAQSTSAVSLPQPDTAPAGFGYHHHPIRTSSQEAQQLFDRGMAHPRNARSLFGLQASLRKQGKETDAAWVQRQFEDAWKNADTKLILQDF